MNEHKGITLFRRILVMVSVSIITMLILYVFDHGRLEDGSFVSLANCANDREYYNLHESQCGLFEFYLPFVAIPFCIGLVIAWAIFFAKQRQAIK